MKNIAIPRYIDSTPQIFFWEMDEFVLIAGVFSFGVILGGMYTILGLLLGFYLVHVFITYKDGGLPGQLNHIAHWHNLLNINSLFKNGGVRRIFK